MMLFQTSVCGQPTSPPTSKTALLADTMCTTPCNCTTTSVSRNTITFPTRDNPQQSTGITSCEKHARNTVGRPASPAHAYDPSDELYHAVMRDVHLAKIAGERFGAEFAFWDGDLYVVHVEKHAMTLSGRFSGAFRSGLRVGDRIVNVNGLDARSVGPAGSKKMLDSANQVDISYVEAACTLTFTLTVPSALLRPPSPATHARKSMLGRISPSGSRSTSRPRSSVAQNLSADSGADVFLSRLGLVLDYNSRTARILFVSPDTPAEAEVNPIAIGHDIVSIGGKSTFGCGAGAVGKVLSECIIGEGKTSVEISVMAAGLVEVITEAGHDCMSQMGMGTIWLRHMVDADYDVALAKNLQAREKRARGHGQTASPLNRRKKQVV